MASTRTAAGPPLRVRSLRPSDLAVSAYHSAPSPGEAPLLWLGVAVVLYAFVLPSPLAALIVNACAVAAGLHLVWRTRKLGPQGFITTPIAVGFTALAAMAGSWPLLLGWPPAISLALSFAAWQLLCMAPEEKTSESWWAHYRLATALVIAGVLKMVVHIDPRTGERYEVLPTLGFVGTPKTDDVGQWVTIRLPSGVPHSDVSAHHAQLAAAFGIPEEQLHVAHAANQPANVVTIGHLKPRSEAIVDAEIPERTDFTQPVRMGTSHLGKAAFFITKAVHTMVVARTRAGKTWLLRHIGMYALLDPRCAFLVMSFKDPKEDWRPAQHLVAKTPPGVPGYVGRIMGEADVDGCLALLRFLLAVCNHRNNLDESERFPVLVVVDEWMAGVNTAKDLNKAKAAEMERLMLILASQAAGFNIHLALTFHRGTTEYLKSGLKANLGQRFVGLTKGGDHEVRQVLEYVPSVLPRRKGEFLQSADDSDVVLFRGERLDDDTWTKVVIPRAERLRADSPHPPLLPVFDPDAAVDDRGPAELYDVEAPEPISDELTLAVHRILEAAGPLPSAAIFDRLPPELEDRPANSISLGARISKMPGVRRRHDGSTRKWEYVPHPLGAPGSLRWRLATGEVEPADEQPVPAGEAVRELRGRGPSPAAARSADRFLAPTGTDGGSGPALEVAP